MSSNQVTYKHKKQLEKDITNLSSNEYNEILNIIRNNKQKYSENIGGIYFNLKYINDPTIHKIIEFVKFAKSSGLKDWRIIWRYIFPNTLTPVLITIAFSISGAVLFEATLSFLGLGVPVEEVSLGNLLMQGKRNMDAWWLIVFPGSILFLLVLSLNLLGRGLSNALNKY